MRIIISGMVLAVLSVSADAGDTITLTIDNSQSMADFELCAVGSCDEDGATISGQIEIELDDAMVPSEISLSDFQFVLDNSLNFLVDLGLGAVTVNASDLQLNYSTPGIQLGPVPIIGGLADFMNIPILPEGDANYNATGLACVLIEAQGLPCSDSISLTTVGEQMADSIIGMISVDGGDVTLVLDAALTIPILPDDPDLAQLSFSGMIVATGTTAGQIFGDFDGDGDIDLNDFGAYLACESGPGGGIIVPTCEIMDFDGDLDVDLHDKWFFQRVFTGE